MQVKCGSQPFLVLHHFIMSNILLQNIVLFQLPQKNDEMIAKCPRVPWECGSFFKPSYKWMGLWKPDCLVSWFFSTHKKNSEKSNRSNDQLPQSKCLQRWHRLAILVPGLGTNRLPTYDPLTLDEMRREKKCGEDFLGCLEQNMNKISGLNLNRWLGKKSLDKYDSSHHYQHLQRSAKMVLKGSQFTIPQV